MKHFVLMIAVLAFSGTALARQSLQDAMRLNPRIAAAVEAVKAAAGVECLVKDNPIQVAPRGPQGRLSVLLQSACYDPNAFNPSQLGQLIVIYYGDGQAPNSPVGDLIDIQFTVFK